MVNNQPKTTPTNHMITRIKFDNVKGRNGDFQLGNITFFTGLQGSGKTTVLDALQIGLLGYHPTLGKTAKALFKLATTNGEAMGVTLETTAGVVARLWKPSGKSIKAIFTGDAPPVVPAALDASLFINAKATARAAMIRQLYPATEDPREALQRAIERAAPDLRIAWPKTDDLAEWQEEVADAIKAAKASASDTANRMRSALEAAQQLATASVAETMTAAEIEAAQDGFRRAELAHAAAQQAVQQTEARLMELRPLANTAEATTTRDIAEIEADLAAARTALANAQAEQRQAEANAAEAAKKRARQQAALRAIEDYQAAYPVGITEPTPPEQIAPPDFKAYDEAIRAHEDAKAALAKAKHAAEEADICPHCGAGREHWSRHRQVIEAPTEAQISALETAVNLCAARRSQLEAEATSYNETAAAAKAAAEAYQDRLREFRAWQLCHDRARQAQAVLADLGEIEHTDDRAEDLAIEIDSLEARIEILIFDAHAARAAEKALAIRAEVDRLEEAKAWAVDELTTTQEAMEKARISAAAAEAARETLIAAQERRRIATEQQATADKADAEQAAATVALDVLKREFQTLASLALEPMLAAANRYLENTGLDPLAAIGLEIGRWKGETWIAFECFSGGEKALATCAMQSALAETGPPEWRIAFIDEFNVVSGPAREAFLANLATATDDRTVTQAVILDNRTLLAIEAQAAEPQNGTLEIHALPSA